MATYFLHVKIFTRGRGSVTKAAAYRAGERIRDERSGAVYGFSKRTDGCSRRNHSSSEDASRIDLEWALNRPVL